MSKQVFISWLRSIELEHPEFRHKLKKKVIEYENQDFTCLIFAVPKKRDTEIIENIGKLINDKL
jgi:hypothetical protein